MKKIIAIYYQKNLLLKNNFLKNKKNNFLSKEQKGDFKDIKRLL